MAEKHYTFIKDNRVVDTYVFADKDDALANAIVQEKGFDKAIWLDEEKTPQKWSSYDEATNTFTGPTPEYLVSIGVLADLPKEITPEQA